MEREEYIKSLKKVNGSKYKKHKYFSLHSVIEKDETFLSKYEFEKDDAHIIGSFDDELTTKVSAACR